MISAIATLKRTLLCRLGVHRFDFYDETIRDPSGRYAKVLTYTWCRRLCPVYGQPVIVNVDTIILPKEPG